MAKKPTKAEAARTAAAKPDTATPPTSAPADPTPAETIAGTVAAQNARDMNDPANRKPGDEGYVGQGLDASVYGKG
ncbi:hypothetical protein ACXN5S_19395 [Pseudoroseicyclus sp. H15]